MGHDDVLISASIRSLASNALGAGSDSASNGTSLNANYDIPNTVVPQSLGRLPTNGLANGNTTVNLLVAGQLYGPDRINQVDLRFAKVLRFGKTRTDVGIDLSNLFNTNDTTSYTAAFVYATNGAIWMPPTTIVSPRFLRFSHPQSD